MKFLRFLLLLLSTVSAVDIDCDFKFYNWSFVDKIYYCDVNTDLSITSRNFLISASNAIPSTDNQDIEGIYSNSQTIHYMPHGLNKIFPNLILIIINESGMKEIYQKDFEQFPKLKFLKLWSNDIEYLEKDLFKFNTELQLIDLENNKISQIYPTIFDHLGKLLSLNLQNNQCVNRNEGKQSGVPVLIKEIKEKCLPLFFIYDEIKDVKNMMKDNFEEIKRRIKNLQRPP